MAKSILTERKVRAARVPPGKTETALYDGGGLVLRVRPGSDPAKPLRVFQFWYARGGRRQRIGLGSYPDVTLTAAREKAAHYESLLAAGITPTGPTAPAAEGAPLIPRTVADLAERWARDYLAHKHKDGGAAAEAALARHALPSLGSVRLADLRKLHVLHILNGLTAADKGRTAKGILSTLRQMFTWAIRQDYLAADPTAGLVKAEYGGRAVSRERVLSAAEIKVLAARMQATRLAGPVGRESRWPVLPVATQAAVWVMLSTLARVGELSAARWEHVDETAATWFIPPEVAKNARPHVIHLSAFALRHLRYLRTFAAGSEWVLPSRNSKDDKDHLDTKAITKQLRDRQHSDTDKPRAGRSVERAALMLDGGVFTSHDLRRTGATMMQALGVAREVIERALNHVEEDRLVRTYQRAELLPERAAAFAALGAHLDGLVPEAATAHLRIVR